MSKRVLAMTLFTGWWIILALGLKAITLDVGELPVDYRTYVIAEERLRTTGSPYVDPEIAQGIWRAMHQNAQAAFDPGRESGEAVEIVSGPYLYPPSLAFLLNQTGLTPLQYLVVLALAVIALGVGWLKFLDDLSLFWLLGMACSIDLIAVFLGGNVEILLVALSLFACRLIWLGHGIFAGLLVGSVLVVKPQFALLFLAFGCLSVIGSSFQRGGLRACFGAAAVALVLMAAEAWRWPAPARGDFLSYLADPGVMQYFALSTEAQWPMNIWNRAPLQVLLELGLSFGTAQALSIGFYLLFLGASVFLLWGRTLHFSLLFALAYVLFLIGRPITWSMPLLAIFVLSAAWPEFSKVERRIATGVACLLGLAHWVAFALFAAGVWPGLLTLQVPWLPWETLLILPGAWGAAVLAARRGLS